MSAHADTAAIAILGGTFDPPHRRPSCFGAGRFGGVADGASVADAQRQAAAPDAAARRLGGARGDDPARGRGGICGGIDDRREIAGFDFGIAAPPRAVLLDDRHCPPRAPDSPARRNHLAARRRRVRRHRIVARMARAVCGGEFRRYAARGRGGGRLPPALARFCEERRATDPADAAARAGRIVCLGAGPLCSSSAIRAKLRAGDCAESDVPPSVAAYAAANGLYR